MPLHRNNFKSEAPCRFGVMVNGPFLSKWELKCIERILELPNAPKLELIIVNASEDTASHGKNRSFLGKVCSVGLRNISYYLFNKHRRVSDCVVSTAIDSYLEKASVLKCTTERRGVHSEYFNKTDISQIRSYQLDFILRFGFGIIRGEILDVPRYGIWSFHHDDEMKYRGSPPCFWEIYHADPVTGSVLQRLTDRLDGGIVLKKGYFKTVSNSYRQNVEQAYMESSKWPAQVCADLTGNRALYFRNTPTRSTAAIRKTPNNFEMAFFLGRLFWNKVSCRVRSWLWVERWAIGIVDGPLSTVLDKKNTVKVNTIHHPDRASYFADPFAVVSNGKLRVFCEEFNHHQDLGQIREIKVEANGEWAVESSLPHISSQHCSYPFLLQHMGETYCIPECHQSGEIALFRLDKQTNKLNRIRTLVPDAAGVDPTLFQHEGRWWLSFTDQNDGPMHNLYLYHSDDLNGDWTPHAQNPVKTDIRSARPAGTPFIRAGKLYRPSQSCARSYGENILINQVLRLSPTEFEEVTVEELSHLKGESFSAGVHTISAAGEKTLIDGKEEVFVFSVFWQRVRSTLKSVRG